MIRCVGPTPPAANTSRVPVVAVVGLYGHPAATVDPVENVPPLATVISCPELLDKLDPVSEPPFPTVNTRSLRAWATSVMLACRFDSVMPIVPVMMVNWALASTGPPPVVAPLAVLKVSMSAQAAGVVIATVINATPAMARAASQPLLRRTFIAYVSLLRVCLTYSTEKERLLQLLLGSTRRYCSLQRHAWDLSSLNNLWAWLLAPKPPLSPSRGCD